VWYERGTINGSKEGKRKMMLPIIGITMGDPTGIGPEIIVKALSMEELFRVCRPIVFGDRGILLKTIEIYFFFP
jgi:4-hydroxy-L-threonine phosphate dehydrogenase PdxA